MYPLGSRHAESAVVHVRFMYVFYPWKMDLKYSREWGLSICVSFGLQACRVGSCTCTFYVCVLSVVNGLEYFLEWGLSICILWALGTLSRQLYRYVYNIHAFGCLNTHI